MERIDHFDLRSFDLNLLVAFDALMQERSVTRAAVRLKVGQPAMSHSLATLRVLLQDELFVRVGTALQPTARATALAAPVRAALAQMQSVLHMPSGFDPATEERTVRIGVCSEVELLLVPDLVRTLRHAAPGVRLLVQRGERGEVYRLLDEGVVDLALGAYDPFTARRHRSQILFESDLACAFHPDQLALSVPIARAEYLSLPHVVMTLTDDIRGCLEASLSDLGAELNVVAACSEFLSLLATASRAPVIATLPGRLARRYGPLFGLAVSPVPLAFRLPAAAMTWSTRLDQDPATSWIRQQIVNLLCEQQTVGAAA